MEWILANKVALSAILLLAVRLIESVLVLLRAKSALGILAVIKEFFRLG